VRTAEGVVVCAWGGADRHDCPCCPCLSRRLEQLRIRKCPGTPLPTSRYMGRTSQAGAVPTRVAAEGWVGLGPAWSDLCLCVCVCGAFKALDEASYQVTGPDPLPDGSVADADVVDLPENKVRDIHRAPHKTRCPLNRRPQPQPERDPCGAVSCVCRRR
jgi:hypothetical protein